jgi:hypothetical protein
VLERRSADNAIFERVVVFSGVVLSGVGVNFLRIVLFVAHSFQVQHLNHFVGNQLLLVIEVVVDFRGSFGDDCDSVGVEAAVESAFEDLTVFDWVLFENFVDVFGSGLDAEALKVLGGVLLFEEFEEGGVFEVDFLS